MKLDYNWNEEKNELEIRYVKSDNEEAEKFPLHHLINELIAINTMYPNNILCNYNIWCKFVGHVDYSCSNDDEYCGGINFAGENLSELIGSLKRLYQRKFHYIPIRKVRIDLLIYE